MLLVIGVSGWSGVLGVFGVEVEVWGDGKGLVVGKGASEHHQSWLTLYVNSHVNINHF